MSRVEINSGGRHVIVDCDGAELDEIVTTTEKLWQDTQAPFPPAGRGTGFAAERVASMSRSGRLAE